MLWFEITILVILIVITHLILALIGNLSKVIELLERIDFNTMIADKKYPEDKITDNEVQDIFKTIE